VNTESNEHNIKRTLLSELGRKISALSFIGLIVFGNIWVIYAFTGKSSPEWLFGGFVAMALTALSGGVLLIADWLSCRISLNKSSENTNLTKNDR
jgi:hypothetical protein